VLERCDNNERRACRELGIPYHTLHGYIRFRPEQQQKKGLSDESVLVSASRPVEPLHSAIGEAPAECAASRIR